MLNKDINSKTNKAKNVIIDISSYIIAYNQTYLYNKQSQ